MMKLEEKNQGEIAVVSLSGNMVGECESDVLHQEIEKLVREDRLRIVLNMGDVDWMGSLCIGAIMREIISVRKKGGDMHLSGLSKKVRRIFEITKLNGIINIYSTTKAAVDGFNRN